jgi:hypothetical protein
MKGERIKFVLSLCIVECVILVLYTVFVGYDVEADGAHAKNNANSNYGGSGTDHFRNSVARFNPSTYIFIAFYVCTHDA